MVQEFCRLRSTIVFPLPYNFEPSSNILKTIDINWGIHPSPKDRKTLENWTHLQRVRCNVA